MQEATLVVRVTCAGGGTPFADGVAPASPPAFDVQANNKKRGRDTSASGDDDNKKESYGQLREKALQQRSKTVPANEFFYIGDEAKRSRPVPPRNQAVLKRQPRRYPQQ